MKNRRSFEELELAVSKIISDFSPGIHLSRFNERTAEIDTIHLYQPGDRRLDAKATARTRMPMYRTFNPEKALTLFLAMDISASQLHGLAEENKLELGVQAAFFLAKAAANANDRIGLIAFDNEIRYFSEPKHDEEEIANYLRMIFERQTEARPGTNLEKTLEKLLSWEPRNALVALISDFCLPVEQETLNLLRQIANQENTTLLSIITTSSQEMPLSLPFSAEISDSEAEGKSLNWNFHSPKEALAYQNSVAIWREKLTADLRRAGSEAVFLDINQDNPLMNLVRYFLNTETA